MKCLFVWRFWEALHSKLSMRPSGANRSSLILLAALRRLTRPAERLIFNNWLNAKTVLELIIIKHGWCVAHVAALVTHILFLIVYWQAVLLIAPISCLIKNTDQQQLSSQCFWWHEQFCSCHRHIDIVQLFCLLRSLFVCLFQHFEALFMKSLLKPTPAFSTSDLMSENIDIHVSLISALKTFWTWLDADEPSVTSVTVVKLPSCPSRGVNASLQPVVHGGASLGRGLKTTLDGGNNKTTKKMCAFWITFTRFLSYIHSAI